ncbi:MAG: aquaporin family protein [Reichenbachiella sp.]
MTAPIAEFIGTAILIYIGGSVNAGASLKNSYGEKAGWLMICVGWGLAVTFAIYAAGQISGAHINPAVTIGLAMSDQLAWSAVPGYLLGQFLGAMFGAILVWLQYLPHWKATEDTATKFGVFSTAPAMDSKFSNLLSELLGTFLLLFALSFLGPQNFAKGLNPLVIGALIVAIGLSLGNTTGFAINPARDLGPRIIHFLLPIAAKGKSNWHYAWIPVIGPIIGGVLGTTTYDALFNQQLSLGLYISAPLSLLVIILAIKEQQ